jgi:hypothetical protein
MLLSYNDKLFRGKICPEVAIWQKALPDLRVNYTLLKRI